MPDTSSDRRPSVLLLAGDVRDDWTRALEAGGIDVVTTGWLDGITAARLRRPELLLVSMDLPEGAVQGVLRAFRAAVEMASLPIIVAGAGAERFERLATPLVLADHYVPDPSDAFAPRVRDAIGRGRVPLAWQPGERAVVRLSLAAFAIVVLRLGLQGACYLGACALPISPAVQWAFLAAFLLAVVASVVVAVAARVRPFSIDQTGIALAFMFSVFFTNGSLVLPMEGAAARFVGYSLGSAGYAAWAWLVLKSRPRSRGVAGALRALAVGLVLFAGAFGAWGVLISR